MSSNVANMLFEVTINEVDIPPGMIPPKVELAAEDKACSKCKTVKPLDGFHRNRTKIGGRDTECRPCRAARKRFAKVSKVCTACHQRKPFSEFMRDREKRDGYDNRCKFCRKEHDRALAERRAWEHKAIAHRQQLFHVPSPRVVSTLDPRKPDQRYWWRISDGNQREAAHSQWERDIAPPSCRCKCGCCVTATGTCLDG